MSIFDTQFVKTGSDTAIVGGRYIVTAHGDVYSIVKGRRKIKPRKHTNGYLRFTFCDGKEQKDIYIHRIVAFLFIENPSKYDEVNHKDGNKENNDISNLEWCNRRMNNLHAFQTGLRKYSELADIARRPRRKARRLQESDVKQIRGSEFNVSNIILAKKYGINRDSIRKIKVRETYKEIV